MTATTESPVKVVEPEVKPQVSGRPYVGLRPYERNEQHLLFGRNQDTRFLSDKILSARLTVLYGQSGLGKSSLLRALVIPKLEENEARVIYFDAWSGEEPERALKETLCKVATQLGIPDAGAGSPTLTELARLVDLAEEGSLVLILDQFEEFLVNHGQRLDPLRKELGALVRATDIDVQIVLSLREEFLAALEPFRQEMLTLFSSTYRLEPLDEAGVHEAIESPAKWFGVGYEAGLVMALIRDLGTGTVGSEPDQTATTGGYKAATGGYRTSSGAYQAPATETDNNGKQEDASGPVDLPMLQLVCSQLWTAAGAPRSGELSLELYKRLGGAKKILDNYVLGVMPGRWPDKVRTARLMKLLAPPSGLKISYSIQDLVSNTDIKKEKVAQEVERLSRCRILRSREYRSGRRYELQHDALIRVVSPWRDKILKQARILRRGAVVGALVIIGLAVGAYRADEARKDLEQNTTGAMRELRTILGPLAASEIMSLPARVQLSDSVFDNAAGYLLWRQSGSERLDALKSLLQDNQDLLTSWYGVDTSGIQYLSFPTADDWPLTFHYSPQRDLNWQAFQATWQAMSKFLTDQWGLPVPRFLRLQEDVTYPGELIGLSGPDLADVLRLEFAQHESRAFLATRDLPQPAQEFLARFNHDTTEWDSLPGLQNGPWWVVPRWSLPVWKVSGHPATDGSGLVAFLLASKLLKHPESILSEAVVELLLLKRVAQEYPQAVAEARAARGSRLRLDLVELVRAGTDLQHLPMVLDALARYPRESSRTVALSVQADLQAGEPSLPSRFHGPWKQAETVSDHEKVTLPASFPEAYGERWLPRADDGSVSRPDTTIRVYLGSELDQHWVQGGELGGELLDRLATFGEGFYRRFGIDLPGARFYRSGHDESLTAKQFRIRVLNQKDKDEDAQPIETEPAKALDRLMAAIDFRVEGLRTHWLTADHVFAMLQDLDPALRRWLQTRYSVTDLKLLLRAVVAPNEEEIEAWATAEDGDSLPIPPESTIRHHEWLLRSLVFWSAAGDLTLIDQTADYLREVQRARLAGRPRPGSGNRVASYVQRGMRALRTGNLAAAGQAFGAATALERSTAVEHFLASYPEELTTALREHVEVACRDLNSIELSRPDRADLEDLIATRAWPESGAIRHAKLCLLGGLAASQREKRNALIADLIANDGDPRLWPAEEARWFAVEIFSHLADFSDAGTLRQHGERFVKQAFGDLNEGVRYATLDTLTKICGGRGGKNWCWNLAYDLVQSKPSSRMQLDLAYSLSYFERPEDLQRALELAQQAEPRAFEGSTSPRASDERLDLARLTRANATTRLASLGQQQHESETEELLRGLLQTRYGWAYSTLADKLIEENRLKEAEAVLLEGLAKWPTWSALRVSLHGELFFVRLLQGDTAAAATTAEELVELASEDSSALFTGALGQILTGSGDWERAGRAFLSTDHEYVPYVAMILYAHMKARTNVDAVGLLEARWALVDSTTWTARLTEGDPSAWREMLIGYYLGNVDSSRIFGDLEDDEAWSQSALHHLPMPRRGLRCEAYFYDALLARSKGDESRATARLRDVLATEHRNYYEYRMARFLLKPEATVASP